MYGPLGTLGLHSGSGPGVMGRGREGGRDFPRGTGLTPLAVGARGVEPDLPVSHEPPELELEAEPEEGAQERHRELE